MCWFLMKKGLSVNGGCRIWSWVFFWLQSASVGECVWLKAVWNCDPPSEDFCIFLWEFQVWWRVATTPHTLANLLFGAELKCDHKIFLLTFASNPPTFNWHLDNFPSVQLQLHLNFWIEIRIKKKKKKKSAGWPSWRKLCDLVDVEDVIFGCIYCFCRHKRSKRTTSWVSRVDCVKL